jgi:hypothetical protein
MPPPSPSVRLLSALLAARDPATVRRVRAVLVGARTLAEGAAELGVSWRTAARWASALGLPARPGRPGSRNRAPAA